MSDPRDEQVVMENGIRLHYRMDAERFPILTPTFRLRSEREDPTHVRLALPFPDGLTSDDIGLHPDYDADGWAIEDGELVFERSIAAGEECETLFGVKGIDEGTEFPLDAVSIEVLDAVEAGTEPERSTELGHIDDLVDRERDTAVRELVGGERETLAGLREEESARSTPRSAITPVESTAGPAAAGGRPSRAARPTRRPD